MEISWGVVFDMDDTLYLERDYIRSGFLSVAHGIAAALPDFSPETVFQFLWSGFEEGVVGDCFDRLLAAFPLLRTEFTVPDLVEAYRTHSPDIRADSAAVDLLARLRRAGARLGLISDGPLDCQERKWQALGLDPLFHECVFTDTWGREFWKPHRLSYERIADAFRLRPAQMIYVADNPAKDFVTPRCLGWRTVRLRTPGQIHFHAEARSARIAAEAEIRCLAELESLLPAMGRAHEPDKRAVS